MKKIIKTLLVVMVLVLALAVFTACEKTDCDHNYVQEFLPGYDATCTTDGLRPGYKCSNCGEVTKEQAVVPAYGHNMAEATCTAPSTCTRGDCTYTEGEALGHSFTIEVEAKDATCLDGYTAHKECDRCGAKNEEYEVLPGDGENGHEFNEDEFFYYPSAPTCTEGAYLAGYCVHCENAFLVDAVEALGHTWVGGDCTTPATCSVCEAEGELVHNVGEDGVCTGCGTVLVETAEELVAALEAGKKVLLMNDIEMDATLKCPYGNSVGVAQKGGELNGNGYTLTVNGSGNYYAIITYGGTIKNLKINAGFRAVVTYTPTEDVVLDNVTIVGDSIGYGFNTAEHATLEGIDLVVKNSTICGWVSFDGGFESVSFENCNFVQGTYNNNVVGRLVKPYVSTTFTNCTFVKNAYLDLSALAAGETVTLVGCKVAGVDVTVDVFTTEEDHAEIPFTYEAPAGVELVLTAVEGGVSFHRHNFAIDVAGKDATCTEDGYTAHKACDCGATEGKEEILSSHADANADAKCDVCQIFIMPEVGTAFNFRLYQANLGKFLYLNGKVNGNYLATSDINGAVDLFLEEVDGGYHIYFMDGETKKFVDVYEYQTGSIGTTISTEAHGVWVWNGELGVFTVTMCDRTVYLGTYNTFNTMSLSDTYRISGDKAADVDVSQFPGRAVVVPAHECDYNEATCTVLATCKICGLTTGELKAHDYTAVAATCTANAKCACGAEKAGTMLEHTYVGGVCVCGKKEGAASLVNASLSFASKDQRTLFSSTQQVWEQNGVKLTNDKYNSTNAVGDYANPVRLYQNSKVTIEGVGMTKIVLTRTNKATADELKSYIVSANPTATVTVSGSNVTVVFDEPVDSFYFVCGKQVQLTKIVVNPN